MNPVSIVSSQEIGSQVGKDITINFAKNASANTQKTTTILRPSSVNQFYILSCWNPSDDTDLTVKVYNVRNFHLYGTAQAGAAGTITLSATSDGNNDFYNNATIDITGGTGAGQSRTISDYTGTTKVATVDSNWDTTPDSTSQYKISISKDSYIISYSYAKKQTITGTSIEAYEKEPISNLFDNGCNTKLVISNDTAVPNNDTDAFNTVFKLTAYA